MSPINLTSSTTAAEWEKVRETNSSKFINLKTDFGNKPTGHPNEFTEEGTRISIIASNPNIFVDSINPIEESTSDILKEILGGENKFAKVNDSSIEASVASQTKLKGIVRFIEGEDAFVIFEVGDEKIERILSTSLFKDEGIRTLQKGDVVLFESNDYGKEIVNRFRYGGNQLFKLSDEQLDELDILYNAARSKKE